jgi:hypothetical protein
MFMCEKAESKLYRTTFVRWQISTWKERSILGPAGLQDRDWFFTYHGRSADDLVEKNFFASLIDKRRRAAA